MKIENMFNNEKGTSPVIGVMLMVVVTVILAAAVSSYSSGMVDSTEAAPVATFTTELVKDQADPYMPGTTYSYLQISEVTGDTIPTDQIKIITINPNADGSVKAMETLPGVTNHVYDAFGYSNCAPFRNSGGFLSADDDFGNYSLKSGTTMVADSWSNYELPAWDANAGAYVVNGTTGNIPGLYSMIADYESLEEGDFITVKLVHTPSEKVIYQSEVEVI